MGLSVFQRGAALGGVADVADGAVAVQPGQYVGGEDLLHQAHGLEQPDPAVFRPGQAAAFLAAVLLGEKGQ